MAKFSGEVTFNSDSTINIQGSSTITELTIASEVQREERSIMLEGTDSDFSNEGSALLLDASASGTDAGEKLLFEANTLDSLTKEDPDA